MELDALGGASASGTFISFEGGEGAGKSTHIGFLAAVLEERGYEVVRLREPGGTHIGESLRNLVLDPANTAMCDRTELLIYEAARAQIVSEVIEPALARGAVVLCDRFFDSTVAYQVYGRGLSRAFVDSANAFACGNCRPNRTVLLAIAPTAKEGLECATRNTAEEGLERATHDAAADRLELAGADFHARVNAGFLEIAQAEPQRVRLVYSAEKKSDTARKVFSALADLFPWMHELLKDPANPFFDIVDVKKFGNKERCASNEEGAACNA